jgi:RimJ/RimL family protein N-acetyltransferase
MSPGQSPVIETERLIVRPATEEDVDLFYALWTNPQVMKNVGFPHGLRITRSEIRERLSKGGGSEFKQLLVVELKATGQTIGEGKLSYPDEEGIAEPDIKLLPAFWGHKYGVEAWRELVAYEFTHTDCDAVHATPNVENIASIRMQEAIGGVRIGEGVYQFPESMREYTTAVHHYIYRVTRADWERTERDRRSSP